MAGELILGIAIGTSIGIVGSWITSKGNQARLKKRLDDLEKELHVNKSTLYAKDVENKTLKEKVQEQERKLRMLEKTEREYNDLKLKLSKLEAEKSKLEEFVKGINDKLSQKEELLKIAEDLIKRKDQKIATLERIQKQKEEEINKLFVKMRELETSKVQAEKKNTINVPREAIATLIEIKGKVSQLIELFGKGKDVHNYRVVKDEEHEEIYSLMFASENRILITAPFLTEDALKKRLPDVERFLESGGELYVIVGRKWNVNKDNSLFLLFEVLENFKRQVKVFTGDIHQKVIIGQERAIITSYNFLSKNNRLKEIGIFIEDSDVAQTLFSSEVQNLQDYREVRKIVFEVESVEPSNTNKSLRIKTIEDNYLYCSDKSYQFIPSFTYEGIVENGERGSFLMAVREIIDEVKAEDIIGLDLSVKDSQNG